MTLSGSYSRKLQTFPDIKQYWHFQRVTGKQYNKLFQRLHLKTLTFSERYWQTILQTFSDFISLSTNRNIFRELLANNTTNFFRFYIKQYWHFQRIPLKLNNSKNFFSEFISHNTDTFRELLPNNIDLFRPHIKQHSHFHRVITKL